MLKVRKLRLALCLSLLVFTNIPYFLEKNIILKSLHAAVLGPSLFTKILVD